MADHDRLSRELVEQLRLAGLHEYSFDAPDDGGFSIHAIDELLTVGWDTNSALANPAHERLLAGDVAHPDVARYGKVLHVMAEAMLEILQTAGFNARLSKDRNTPATVEITDIGASHRVSEQDQEPLNEKSG